MTWMLGIAELIAILALAIAWGWAGGLLFEKALARHRKTGAYISLAGLRWKVLSGMVRRRSRSRPEDKLGKGRANTGET